MKCDVCNREFGGLRGVYMEIEDPERVQVNSCGLAARPEVLKAVRESARIEYGNIKDMFGKTEFVVCYPCRLISLGIKPVVRRK